jgi:hypothetical protein
MSSQDERKPADDGRAWSVVHQKQARPLHNRIMKIFGLLAGLLVTAGVVTIVISATTDFELFGAHLNTRYIGLALIGIGVLIMFVSMRLVLKNQLDLAALPSNESKSKRRREYKASRVRLQRKEAQKPIRGSEQQLTELQGKLPSMAEDLGALEMLLSVDVPASLNKMRYIVEKALLELCAWKSIDWGQAEPTLERMIGPLVAAGCIPRNIAIHVRTIQTNASPGSHYQESAMSNSHVTIALSALTAFLNWFSENGLTNRCS